MFESSEYNIEKKTEITHIVISELEAVGHKQ